MAELFAVVLEGLDALKSFDELSDKSKQAAQRAVNAATRRAYAAAGRQITNELNFPARYVTGKSARMQITKFAKPGDLSATITARNRPTSLARFVTGSISVGGARKAGVRVEVKKGSVQRLKGAWLIRLRAGNADLDTQSNLGLAVRTRNGQPPPGYKPYKLADNVYLLYGPSIGQALYSVHTQKGVATDITPATLDFLEAEFWRQMDLK